jgi:hypothetical protein
MAADIEGCKLQAESDRYGVDYQYIVGPRLKMRFLMKLFKR